MMRLGNRRIQSLTDQTDPNAIALLVAQNPALGFVSRETPWNCLMSQAFLTLLAPITPDNVPNPYPPTPPVWVPNTNYAVNAYVTFAGQLYQCLIANTSSNSFTVDLTRGYWFETTFFYPNYLGPFLYGNAGPLYQFQYAYKLPVDFVLLCRLNGAWCSGGWGGGLGGGSNSEQGAPYQVYQNVLLCDTPQANIQYVRWEPDSTKYDNMFIECLTLKWAALVATSLRKDDATLTTKMEALYDRAITKARTKNGGEMNPRRYFLPGQSRFVRSRRWSTNG